MSKIGYLSTGNERPKRLVEGGGGGGSGVAVSPGSGISLTAGSHQSQLHWYTHYFFGKRETDRVGVGRRELAPDIGV